MKLAVYVILKSCRQVQIRAEGNKYFGRGALASGTSATLMVLYAAQELGYVKPLGTVWTFDDAIVVKEAPTSLESLLVRVLQFWTDLLRRPGRDSSHVQPARLRD